MSADDVPATTVPPIGTIVYAKRDGVVTNLKTLKDEEFDAVCKALNIQKPPNTEEGEPPRVTVPPKGAVVYIDQSDRSLNVMKNLSDGELAAVCKALGIPVPAGDPPERAKGDGEDIPAVTVPPHGR